MNLRERGAFERDAELPNADELIMYDFLSEQSRSATRTIRSRQELTASLEHEGDQATATIAAAVRSMAVPDEEGPEVLGVEVNAQDYFQHVTHPRVLQCFYLGCQCDPCSASLLGRSFACRRRTPPHATCVVFSSSHSSACRLCCLVVVALLRMPPVLSGRRRTPPHATCVVWSSSHPSACHLC